MKCAGIKYSHHHPPYKLFPPPSRCGFKTNALGEEMASFTIMAVAASCGGAQNTKMSIVMQAHRPESL